MNIPQHCDVVVIGGGPAGSLTGTYLAQAGHQVVLFDKQRHPRYVVGESILPDFWKYTDAAGCSDKIMAEGFIKKDGGTVIWDGKISGVAFKNFGFSRPALHVERDRFDFILLENAREKGVKVFEEVGVTQVNFADPDQPVVHYRAGSNLSGTISCRYVVDASGQSAVIGRQLGLRVVDEGFRFMSVWGYFKDSKYISYGGKVHPFEAMKEIPPTTFVTSLDHIGDNSWCWHIPQREATSVGLILPSKVMKSFKTEDEDWEKYFLRACMETPILNSLLEGATLIPDSVQLIRNYSYRSSRTSGPGYYLVGDAAGFVDPIFSLGVLVAMYSAYVAAWAISQSLCHPATAEKSRKIFDRQLQGRVELARSLALPHYGKEGYASDTAKLMMRFERDNAQDLMMTVSGLTSRSENFKSLSEGEPGREIAPDQLLEIEAIDFG